MIRNKIIAHAELPAVFDFVRYLKKCFGAHKEDAVKIETHTWTVAVIILLLNAARVEAVKPLYAQALAAALTAVGFVGDVA